MNKVANRYGLSWTGSTNSTNFILEKELIGTENRREVISDLGDTGGCLVLLKDSKCMTTNGLIIWKREELDYVSENEFQAKFEAQTASAGHIVVEALKGAFTINPTIPNPQSREFSSDHRPGRRCSYVIATE